MTILFPSPIFGPIHSRRLGVSLGVNLLPSDGKVCSFDCIYCECGFNADFRPHSKLPTRQEVSTALEKQLGTMRDNNAAPDVITFAGNGEPTLHPDFAGIIDDTLELRNKYFPNAKVSVLSNSTRILRQSVFEALKKVDNNILKLDTIDPEYIEILDRPTEKIEIEAIIAQMKRFKGHCIIQTMFLSGEWQGHQISNVSPQYIEPWLEALVDIAPSEVMIYTIDRETPAQKLQKATPEELDKIAELVRSKGLKCQVSY